MPRKTNEDPQRIATTPLALRDEDLAAVAGASLEAYVALRGVKTGPYKGEPLIGVGTCTK